MFLIQETVDNLSPSSFENDLENSTADSAKSANVDSVSEQKLSGKKSAKTENPYINVTDESLQHFNKNLQSEVDRILNKTSNEDVASIISDLNRKDFQVKINGIEVVDVSLESVVNFSQRRQMIAEARTILIKVIEDLLLNSIKSAISSNVTLNSLLPLGLMSALNQSSFKNGVEKFLGNVSSIEMKTVFLATLDLTDAQKKVLQDDIAAGNPILNYDDTTTVLLSNDESVDPQNSYLFNFKFSSSDADLNKFLQDICDLMTLDFVRGEGMNQIILQMISLDNKSGKAQAFLQKMTGTAKEGVNRYILVYADPTSSYLSENASLYVQIVRLLLKDGGFVDQLFDNIDVSSVADVDSNFTSKASSLLRAVEFDPNDMEKVVETKSFKTLFKESLRRELVRHLQRNVLTVAVADSNSKIDSSQEESNFFYNALNNIMGQRLRMNQEFSDTAASSEVETN